MQCLTTKVIKLLLKVSFLTHLALSLLHWNTPCSLVLEELQVTREFSDQPIVRDLSGKVQLALPPVLECDDKPVNQAENPTPHVAHYYPHMSDITD